MQLLAQKIAFFAPKSPFFAGCTSRLALAMIVFCKEKIRLDFPNPPYVLVFRVYLSSVRCGVY